MKEFTGNTVVIGGAQVDKEQYYTCPKCGSSDTFYFDKDQVACKACWNKGDSYWFEDEMDEATAKGL